MRKIRDTNRVVFLPTLTHAYRFNLVLVVVICTRKSYFYEQTVSPFL